MRLEFNPRALCYNLYCDTREEHERLQQVMKQPLTAIDSVISNRSTIIPEEPKTAHWIKTGDYYIGAYGNIDYVECSYCNRYSLEKGDYCPNCGAKMCESQESEDIIEYD